MHLKPATSWFPTIDPPEHPLLLLYSVCGIQLLLVLAVLVKLTKIVDNSAAIHLTIGP